MSNSLDCWSDWLRLIDADRRMVHQTARQVFFESAFPFTEKRNNFLLCQVGSTHQHLETHADVEKNSWSFWLLLQSNYLL